MQNLCRKFKTYSKTLVDGVLDTLYPNCCPVCGTTLTGAEQLMCLKCLVDLPRTDLHKSDFNEIHLRLGSHVPVDKAMSWFWYYRGSEVARLITDAKYRDRPIMLKRAARIYAEELAADNCSISSFTDVIVPVAMHWSRRLRRGYNQCEYLAEGIATAEKLPVSRCVRAVLPHDSQTRLGAEERLHNISGTLELSRGDTITGRRVLLVDDIITTGATLTAHAEVIAMAQPASISILSLGLTHLV